MVGNNCLQAIHVHATAVSDISTTLIGMGHMAGAVAYASRVRVMVRVRVIWRGLQLKRRPWLLRINRR